MNSLYEWKVCKFGIVKQFLTNKNKFKMKKNLYTLFTVVVLLFAVSALRAQHTITFMVNMTQYFLIDTNAISPNGVHMTGNIFNIQWSPPTSTGAFTDMGNNVFAYTVSTDTLFTPTDPEYKFKFINSFAAGFSWGVCSRDQECPPANAGACVTSGGDRILALVADGLPAFDAVYYASWDSCSDAYLAPVGIQEVHGSIASLDVYPNLVSNFAEANYVLLKSAKVNVTVRDFTGKVLQTLVDKQQAPGEYRLNVYADNYSNGIYFVQANVNGTTINKRFVVNR
jgi:hypothetical protein